MAEWGTFSELTELSQKDDCIVNKKDDCIIVTTPKCQTFRVREEDVRKKSHRFHVDFCFHPENPETSTQEAVYGKIGVEIVNSIVSGYNACILAYGHSASGKTYTMMGMANDPGLTPRICQGIFEMLHLKSVLHFQIAVSFLEIYNEKVRDLLKLDEGETFNSFPLRVREHPKSGPYVQGLSQHIVTEKSKLLELLNFGNRRRSTATTENNIYSSRSHAVFTLLFKQSDAIGYAVEISGKVHLVDLAGSERANATQSKARLKEGANINKSLVTLGNVISALAERGGTQTRAKKHPKTKTWQPFVPYRNSVLTWLLKDTLGGNSNTIMIATISPASSCFSETLSTLRYTERAKKIINQPIVNEDPKSKIIRKLKEEIARLKAKLPSESEDGSESSIKEYFNRKTTKMSSMETSETNVSFNTDRETPCRNDANNQNLKIKRPECRMRSGTVGKEIGVNESVIKNIYDAPLNPYCSNYSISPARNFKRLIWQNIVFRRHCTNNKIETGDRKKAEIFRTISDVDFICDAQYRSFLKKAVRLSKTYATKNSGKINAKSQNGVTKGAVMHYKKATLSNNDNQSRIKAIKKNRNKGKIIVLSTEGTDIMTSRNSFPVIERNVERDKAKRNKIQRKTVGKTQMIKFLTSRSYATGERENSCWGCFQQAKFEGGRKDYNFYEPLSCKRARLRIRGTNQKIALMKILTKKVNGNIKAEFSKSTAGAKEQSTMTESREAISLVSEESDQRKGNNLLVEDDKENLATKSSLTAQSTSIEAEESSYCKVSLYSASNNPGNSSASYQNLTQFKYSLRDINTDDNKSFSDDGLEEGRKPSQKISFENREFVRSSSFEKGNQNAKLMRRSYFIGLSLQDSYVKLEKCERKSEYPAIRHDIAYTWLSNHLCSLERLISLRQHMVKKQNENSAVAVRNNNIFTAGIKSSNISVNVNVNVKVSKESRESGDSETFDCKIHILNVPSSSTRFNSFNLFARQSQINCRAIKGKSARKYTKHCLIFSRCETRKLWRPDYTTRSLETKPARFNNCITDLVPLHSPIEIKVLQVETGSRKKKKLENEHVPISSRRFDNIERNFQNYESLEKPEKKAVEIFKMGLFYSPQGSSPSKCGSPIVTLNEKKGTGAFSEHKGRIILIVCEGLKKLEIFDLINIIKRASRRKSLVGKKRNRNEKYGAKALSDKGALQITRSTSADAILNSTKNSCCDLNLEVDCNVKLAKKKFLRASQMFKRYSKYFEREFDTTDREVVHESILFRAKDGIKAKQYFQITNNLPKNDESNSNGSSFRGFGIPPVRKGKILNVVKEKNVRDSLSRLLKKANRLRRNLRSSSYGLRRKQYYIVHLMRLASEAKNYQSFYAVGCSSTSPSFSASSGDSLSLSKTITKSKQQSSNDTYSSLIDFAKKDCGFKIEKNNVSKSDLVSFDENKTIENTQKVLKQLSNKMFCLNVIKPGNELFLGSDRQSENNGRRPVPADDNENKESSNVTTKKTTGKPAEESNRNEKKRKGGIKRRVTECVCECKCKTKENYNCTGTLLKAVRSTFELNTFGPGTKHCSFFCIYCRKKDRESYCSNPALNTDCSVGRCRLNYYGHCPCSGAVLRAVISRPRAYMQHLLNIPRCLARDLTS